MITEGEARQTYSERLWNALDAVRQAASVMNMESASGIVERAVKGLASLLDEIAAKEYCVRLVDHVRNKDVCGIALDPIQKQERARQCTIRKSR